MKINYFTWYGNRQIKHCPKHFVKCNASVSSEARHWVIENLQGRFHIDSATTFLFDEPTIYFEDPQEATLFELRWS